MQNENGWVFPQFFKSVKQPLNSILLIISTPYMEYGCKEWALVHAAPDLKRTKLLRKFIGMEVGRSKYGIRGKKVTKPCHKCSCRDFRWSKFWYYGKIWNSLPNLIFPIYSFQHSVLLLWLCSGITKLSMAWTRSFYLSWGHVPWCQCDNTPIMIEAWLWLEFQNLALSGGCCSLLRYDNLIPQRID